MGSARWLRQLVEGKTGGQERHFSATHTIRFAQGFLDRGLHGFQSEFRGPREDGLELGSFLLSHRLVVEAERLQITAHRKNRALLRAANGVEVERLVVVSQGRCERIISWLREHASPEELRLHVDEILADLKFSVVAEKFEQAFQDLGTALGFACQRPDKEWKEGPDNLWGLLDNQFLLVECKSEVDPNRSDVSKSEAGQMNTACAWFAMNYKGAKASKIMITPAGKLAKGVAFNDEVRVMRQPELQKLARNARQCFLEFEGMNLNDLTENKVQQVLDAHGLSVETLVGDYARSVR